MFFYFFTFATRFGTKSKLQRHVKCVHERYYQTVCHVCAKVYNSVFSLAQHLLEHSDNKRPRIVCKLCGKTFKDANILQKHMYRTHESQQFQCPHCPKMSPNRNALARHISSMHNCTVHKCHLCNKEFKRAVALTVRNLMEFKMDERTNAFYFFRSAGTCGHAYRREFIQLRLLSENVQIKF